MTPTLKSLVGFALGRRAPHTQGTLRTRGVRSEVVLRRDAHGVVYVSANDSEDAFYGLGFAQGQDRAFHLELLARVARGTLSALVGAEMLSADQLSRRVGFHRLAMTHFAALSDETRATLTAFSRGVNDGRRSGLSRRPHELTLLAASHTDFEPVDVLAVLKFVAFALSSNWDAEIARLRVLHDDGPEALRDVEAAHPDWLADEAGDRLSADLEVLRAAESLAGVFGDVSARAGTQSGSNAWAVAGARTSTGRPLLVCDPHLGPSLPAPWYLAHVRTPTWAMSGAFFVSQPTPSLGHNDRVAWGLTAGHADNTDLFIERVGPDGRSVREGDRWVPCEVREELIKVRGGSDVVERVLITPRGPVVSPALGGDRSVLSLRATWMAARPMGVYELHHASSCDEARAKFVSHPGISENRVFADVDGHIAWQMVGDAPRRKKGHGMIPMPGWDPEVGWHDAPLPFDALPGLRDPAAGFVASANNKPAQEPGAAFLSADWLDGYRYERIVERLSARADWDVPRAMAMQLDRESLWWRDVRAAVLEALRGASSSSAVRARALLSAWDGVVSPDSAAASVFELMMASLACRMLRARCPNAARWALGEPTNAILPRGIMPLRRLAQLARLLTAQPAGWFGEVPWATVICDEAAAAVATLEARFGATEAQWAWGRVRPLTLLHPLGTLRALAPVFNLGPIAVGGDGSTIPQASVDFRDPLGPPTGVANLRLAIDVGRWENSRWSLAGGQSGNPFSKHYDDLLSLWEKGEGVPIAWSPEAVESAAVATLRIVAGAG